MSTNPYQIEFKIRNAMILALRDIFSPSNNPAGWKYPYIQDANGMWAYDSSKIFIGDIIPQDNAAFPALVVDTYSGNETRYLGPEDLNYEKNSFNVVTEDNHFASITSTVTINIYIIDDTIARDEIIDTIYDHFKDLTHQLAINGIEIIKSTMPSETRVMQDNRWWITNRIVIDVYSEWVDTPLPIVNVSGLGVTVPLTGSVPVIISPLFYNWSASGTPFNIVNVINSSTLEVDSLHLVVGNHISQGLNTATILTVDNSDTNHPKITIADTTGWADGPAIDMSIIIPFNYQITAINSPTSYGASPLPTGLSVDSSTGLISGTTVATGTYYVTLAATNSSGTGNLSATFTVS